MSKVTINDLFDLKTISTPAYHPEGNQFLYVVNQINQTENNYYSDIYLYNCEKGESKKIVANQSLNTHPTWNKAGTAFLFLSNKTGKNQVHLYSILTKTSKQLTEVPEGVQQILWHTDDEHFFFGTKSLDNTLLNQKLEEHPNVFITESIDYLENGKGLIDPNCQNVVCLGAIDSGEVKIVTSYHTAYGLKNSLAVSSDGKYLVVEKKLASSDPFNHDSGLFQINLEDFSEEKITESYSTGAFGEPTYTSKNDFIGMIGSTLPYQTVNQFGVFAYNVKEKSMIQLTEKFDQQVSDFAVSDTKATTSNPLLQWSERQNCFYTLVSLEGRVSLFSITLDGRIKELSSKSQHVTDFALNPKKDELLVCVSTAQIPSQLIKIDLDSLEQEELTTAVKEVYREKNFSSYKKIEYQATDGGRVPGFIVSPTDFIAGKKYPLVVNIHGGPYAMHADTFHHEVQLLAAQGYFVLLVNPRGSFGYGQEHLNGVVGRYGQEDYTDILTAVDGIIEEIEEIDVDRLFVTGGSYGGFMVNWIISHTNRFKAAITQRSMSNFVSMIGTSDIGYHFFVEENGADILNPEKLWEKSPLAYVKNVETPVLIMQSEQDYRCPMEQAEQWFRALKYLKKEARFVRFNHADHELSRSGLPSLRQVRLQEMIDWLKKYDQN